MGNALEGRAAYEFTLSKTAANPFAKSAQRSNQAQHQISIPWKIIKMSGMHQHRFLAQQLRSPTPHRTASPEPAAPHTIRLPRIVAGTPSAPPVAGPSPQDLLAPSAAIATAHFFLCSNRAGTAHWIGAFIDKIGIGNHLQSRDRRSPQLPAARSSPPMPLSSAATPQSSKARSA